MILCNFKYLIARGICVGNMQNYFICKWQCCPVRDQIIYEEFPNGFDLRCTCKRITDKIYEVIYFLVAITQFVYLLFYLQRVQFVCPLNTWFSLSPWIKTCSSINFAFPDHKISGNDLQGTQQLGQRDAVNLKRKIDCI